MDCKNSKTLIKNNNMFCENELNEIYPSEETIRVIAEMRETINDLKESIKTVL